MALSPESANIFIKAEAAIEAWLLQENRKQQLVYDNLPLAVYLARRYSNGFKPNQDTHQDAYTGLVEAADRFDEKRGMQFGKYAHLRIKGAVVDGQRRNSPFTRDQLKLSKLETEAWETLAQLYHREPTTTEVAARLGSTEKDLEGLNISFHSLDEPLRTQNGEKMSTLSDQIEDPNQVTDFEEIEFNLSYRKQLQEALQTLSPRLRKVIEVHVYEERSLKEAGLELGVSISRASQLFADAIRQLQQRLNP